MEKYQITTPEFEKLFRAEVLLGHEYPLGDIGNGYSEITPVIGGQFAGKLNGKILDFGGDWGLLYSGTVNLLDTKYLLKTDDDAIISISCKGKLIMDYNTMIAVSGDDYDAGDYYFRQSITFSTGEEKYKWLNNIIAFGISIITPEGNVCVDVYELK